MLQDVLTKRQYEIAWYVAWGYPYKEIPDLVEKKKGKKPISVHTVENTIAEVYEILEIQKATELSPIVLMDYLELDPELCPNEKIRYTLIDKIRRAVSSVGMVLVLVATHISCDQDVLIRSQRSNSRLCRTTTAISGKSIVHCPLIPNKTTLLKKILLTYKVSWSTGSF